MRTLIRFFVTYRTFFLFLFLEIIALFLVFNHNQFQRIQFLNSSNVVVGKIYQWSNTVSEYFNLKTINNNLAQENTELRNKIQAQEDALNFFKHDVSFNSRQKQAIEKDYTFITAKVVNATTNRQKNYITLDKGSSDGIQPEMGVINESGVIGIVSSVSSHFSTVVPILNPYSDISAKIKNKSKTGSLIWDGTDARIALLQEVPSYIPIAKGDTIVTSGYSAIFPEGIPIGKILTYEKGRDDFYSIKVSLFPDFNQLSYVDVIDYKYAEEKKELEKKESAND